LFFLVLTENEKVTLFFGDGHIVEGTNLASWQLVCNEQEIEIKRELFIVSELTGRPLVGTR
jgi:hypothetical protein